MLKFIENAPIPVESRKAQRTQRMRQEYLEKQTLFLKRIETLKTQY